MSDNGIDSDKLLDRQPNVIQAFRDYIRKDLTPKQREFFNLPEIVEEGSLHVVRHRGSKAWLSACGDTIQLTMIQTEESQRRQGHASQLLHTICSLADRIGVTLSLRAEPKARKIGLVQKQLVDWYGRYGFEGGPERMTRRPGNLDGRSTKQTLGSGEPTDGK